MQMHFIMKNLALCNRDNHCVGSPGKTANCGRDAVSDSPQVRFSRGGCFTRSENELTQH